MARYSPEYNPIEPYWSKMKNELRTRAARTLHALEAAVAASRESIIPQNARGWFSHCGYKFTPD